MTPVHNWGWEPTQSQVLTMLEVNVGSTCRKLDLSTSVVIRHICVSTCTIRWIVSCRNLFHHLPKHHWFRVLVRVQPLVLVALSFWKCCSIDKSSIVMNDETITATSCRVVRWMFRMECPIKILSRAKIHF